MFTKAGLSPKLTKELNNLKFTTPTPIQEQSIPVILSGADVVGKSQTGSGKTFAFGLPAIHASIGCPDLKTLIVCPTRELANQVCDELKRVATPLDVLVTPIYGGADMGRQIKALKKANIVVGTPGRIMDHLRRKSLKLNNLSCVVLDEADEMLNMGFREDIESILKSAPSQRQTIMFSATMPKEILDITKKHQTDPVHISIGQDEAVSTIEQNYIDCKKDKKIDIMLALYKHYNPQLSIIFCNTKRMVDSVVLDLNAFGLKAMGLHGDLRQSQRKRVMDNIKNNKKSTNILVATDVAARGIDIKGVDFVFNYDLPYDVQFYTHRIGRTARIGKSGIVVNLVNTKGQLAALKDFGLATKANITELLVKEDVVILTQNVINDLDIKTRLTDAHKRPSKSKSKDSSSRERKPRDSKPRTDRKDRKDKTDRTDRKGRFSKSDDSGQLSKDNGRGKDKKNKLFDLNKVSYFDDFDAYEQADDIMQEAPKKQSRFENKRGRKEAPKTKFLPKSKYLKQLKNQSKKDKARKEFEETSSDKKDFGSKKTFGKKKDFGTKKPFGKKSESGFKKDKTGFDGFKSDFKKGKNFKSSKPKKQGKPKKTKHISKKSFNK